jgi:hypothetical protein
MIRRCTFVRFGRPVTLDVREDPRTTVDGSKEAAFYDQDAGYVIVQRDTEWVVIVPPSGSTIRGAGYFNDATDTRVFTTPTLAQIAAKSRNDLLAAKQQNATGPVGSNGQQQPAPSDSPPPARPIQKSGRVQR